MQMQQLNKTTDSNKVGLEIAFDLLILFTDTNDREGKFWCGSSTQLSNYTNEEIRYQDNYRQLFQIYFRPSFHREIDFSVSG